MTERNAMVEAWRQRRWDAAMDLVRAQDGIVLLGKVSLVTGGQVGITAADTERLRNAQRRWSGLR